jgi:hypothetical protein
MGVGGAGLLQREADALAQLPQAAAGRSAAAAATAADQLLLWAGRQRTSCGAAGRPMPGSRARRRSSSRQAARRAGPALQCLRPHGGCAHGGCRLCILSSPRCRSILGRPSPAMLSWIPAYPPYPHAGSIPPDGRSSVRPGRILPSRRAGVSRAAGRRRRGAARPRRRARGSGSPRRGGARARGPGGGPGRRRRRG